MAESTETKPIRPFWIWPLVALVIGVAAWVIFAPGERGDTAPIRERGIQAILGTPQHPYTEVTVVGRRDEAVGQHVHLSELRMDRKVGENAFWATKQGIRLLVVAEGEAAGEAQAFRPGDTVSLLGTIQRFPAHQEAQERWHLSGRARDYEGVDKYIAASRIGRPGEVHPDAGGAETMPAP